MGTDYYLYCKEHHEGVELYALQAFGFVSDVDKSELDLFLEKHTCCNGKPTSEYLTVLSEHQLPDEYYEKRGM